VLADTLKIATVDAPAEDEKLDIDGHDILLSILPAK
jgi:hypothetical protein